MNILLISSYLPFPLHSGGDIRLYNLIKLLGQEHTITLICEKRSFQTQEDIDAVKRICRNVITVPRKKQWSLRTILKSGFSSHSFLFTGHQHEEMKYAIKKALEKDSYDLIHVETSYVFQNVPQTSLPIVLVEHNVEYMVYQRFLEKSPFFLRPFLALDVKKIQAEEEKCWKKATHVVAVSQKEKEIIEKTGVKVTLVPNGVDLEAFQYKKNMSATKEKRILFIGDYKWMQNRDSVRWIVSDIWPRIEKETESTVLLWLIGRSMPEDILKLKHDRVIVEGASDRPAAELFANAAVLLAPIRIGGGSQYKILEAMAVGTPVVTTSTGAEGLRVLANDELLVADTSSELAKKTIALLTDEKLSSQIAKKARLVIEDQYSWEQITHTLEKVYKEIHAV